MSVVLLILGVVVTAAGIAAFGFAIPLNDFTLSTTLIITGTIAVVGGFILVGLSAVITELGRVAEGLKNRAVTPRSNSATKQGAESQEPALQPVIASVAPPAALNQAPIPPPAPPAQPAAPGPVIAPPAPAAAAGQRAPAQPSLTARPEMPSRQPHPGEAYQPAPSAVEVSAAAIERLRSSIPRTERPRAEPSGADIDEAPLSPNGAGSQPRAPEGAPSEPRITAEDRDGDAAVEALKASRLDFLFRSKPAAQPTRPPPQQPANFDAYWPADARQPGRPAPGEPRPRADQRADQRFDQRGDDQIERQTPYAAPSEPVPQAQVHAPVPAPIPAHEPPPAILKSGVVDGMAYTLYADGSIEAKLPHGTVRFGSIAELRAHIESNS